MTVLLQLDRISRAFPGVQALQGVSFAIEAGKVHALVGENGAGKSTLIKILAGVLKPDNGSLRLAGEAYRPRDPRDAIRHGISTLHQELNLLPTHTVAANILLGQEPVKRGLIDREVARTQARRALEQLHVRDIPFDAPIERLTIGQRQIVALAKALLNECRLLIMDEPTAALNSAEAEALFAVIQTLTARGVAILYVSHRLAEIFQLAHRVTVLRDGEHIRTTPIGATTPVALVADMLGRSLIGAFPARRRDVGEVVLAVHQISAPRAFADVSFELRAGEVLAITGLTGSGKTELGRALFGDWPIARGQVHWFGESVAVTPQQAVAAGVGSLPEDRQNDGLLIDTAVQRNIGLAALPHLINGWGLIDRSAEQQTAQQQVHDLQIKTPALETPVRILSGGNQQKVALAKWLACGARALILMEPTQGIDVGVKFEIYDLIAQLSRAGTAIVLISSDLAEVTGLAHRVLIMHGGHVAADRPIEQTTAEEIMRLAAGVSAISDTR
jgi:ABC-type sugar transport system ATPase subunit